MDDQYLARGFFEGLVRMSERYELAASLSGAEQAIVFCDEHPADLVLMDYELPIVNGPQIVEMLHSDSVTGQIPVMFLTGKNEKEFVMSVIDLKPVDYLLKTIDRTALLGKLKKFFGGQG